MSPDASRSLTNVLARWTHSISFSGSLAGAARSLRRQFWLWPLVAAVVLSAAGWLLYRTVESSLQENMAGELQAILAADLAALDIWLEVQRDDATDTAGVGLLRQNVEPLVALAERGATDAELLQSPQQSIVRQTINPTLEPRDFNGFILVDAQGRVVSSFRDELIGKNAKDLYEDVEFITTTLGGAATVSRPMPSAALLPDRRGRLRAGVPTMFACAPVRDEAGEVIAALCLRIPPDVEFTKILNVARFGDSGETYAFNREGLLLSSSRFGADLKTLGLLPDTEDAESILTLRLRDPLADLTKGERTPLGAERPLTRMAVEATAGRDGVDAAGYRDYRGALVVGAWRWLPQYNFGVATEIDWAEAYSALGILRMAFWLLFGLLALAAVGMLVAMLLVSRMRLALKTAAIESRKLGQYSLEEKLGEGGMGVVYKARHAFLRRPTAIKLLNPALSSEEAVSRFAREVQLTSQLTHPNTIGIFDYGHTEEGLFYYVMEYLDGISLETLVRRFGPQPEGRVVAILEQVCGSLAEAHGLGLVHRDIKPANILLNRRAGMCDVVKVLDFGLVKSVDGGQDATVTLARSIIGTPQYMSPESIVAPADVDARSDLYAVGAVGYYLLTGQPVFEGSAAMEVCNQHLNRQPPPPSSRTGAAVSADLERLILRCLAKKREDRPQTAHELADLLTRVPAAGRWTRVEAQAWWDERMGETQAVPTVPPAAETAQPDETVLLPAPAAGGERRG